MEAKAQESTSPSQDAIVVKDLTFRYSPDTPPVLRNLSMTLPYGSRLLLTGPNGAGKSTLLNVLNGRHMHKEDQVVTLGRSAFYDTTLNNDRTFMGSGWATRTVAFAGYGVGYSADIPVKEMQQQLQEEYPERRDELLELLQINPDWRFHKLSDGQRKRVQIFMQLLRPSKLILLDEITTDLDIISRADFLEYIKNASIRDGITIVYATHIFDGLDDWATHLGYVNDGNMKILDRVEEVEDFQRNIQAKVPSPLLRTVEAWMRKDLEEKKKRNIKESQAPADPTSRFEKVESKGDAGGFGPGRFYNYWG